MGHSGDHPYAVVDVFADSPLRGNPLAIVPNADRLDEAVMRAIAVEFNLSETTFILAPTKSGADFRLRSFTPVGNEVSGAGHNALGAWWWLAETGVIGNAELAHQQLGDAVLPVFLNRSRTGKLSVGLKQSSPHVAGTASNISALATLGLEQAEVNAAPDGTVVVSTGVPHLLVEVSSRDAVDRAVPTDGPLRATLTASGAQGCYLYTLDVTGPEKAYARFFNPTVGIREDPATGSAAGPLGWLLGRRGLAQWGEEITILQGVKMGRESRLAVVAEPETVSLHGSAVVTATGHLHLS